MIAGITAKATIVTAIFKLIFFRHNFVAVDNANSANWDFMILFHSLRYLGLLEGMFPSFHHTAAQPKSGYLLPVLTMVCIACSSCRWPEPSP